MSEQTNNFGEWMEREVTELGVAWKDLAAETGLSIAGLRRIRVGEVEARGVTKKQVRAALEKFRFKKEQDRNFEAHWATEGRDQWAAQLRDIANKAAGALPKDTVDQMNSQLRNIANHALNQPQELGLTLTVPVGLSLDEVQALTSVSVARIENTLQHVAKSLIAAELDARRAVDVERHTHPEKKEN